MKKYIFASKANGYTCINCEHPENCRGPYCRSCKYEVASLHSYKENNLLQRGERISPSCQSSNQLSSREGESMKQSATEDPENSAPFKLSL